MIAPLALALGADWREDAEACLAGVPQYLLNVELCSQALQTAPAATSAETRSSLHARRGLVLGWLGETELALADYARALELNPLSASALTQRSMLVRGLGRLDSAMGDLHRAVALSPRYPPAYRERGFTLFLQGETEAALTDLDRALELDPDDPQTVAMRGIVRYAARDWAAALSDFRRTEELHYPYDYGVLWQRLCAARLRSVAGGPAVREPEHRLDVDEWPAPIVRYFAGEVTEVEVIAAVERTVAERPQRRAGFFYIAEWMLLGGAPARAREIYGRVLGGGDADLGEPTAEARLAADRLRVIEARAG